MTVHHFRIGDIPEMLKERRPVSYMKLNLRADTGQYFRWNSRSSEEIVQKSDLQRLLAARNNLKGHIDDQVDRAECYG